MKLLHDSNYAEVSQLRIIDSMSAVVVYLVSSRKGVCDASNHSLPAPACAPALPGSVFVTFAIAHAFQSLIRSLDAAFQAQSCTRTRQDLN